MSEKTVVVVGRSVRRIADIDKNEEVRFHVWSLMNTLHISNVTRYEFDAALGMGMHQAKVEAGGVYSVYKDGELVEGSIDYNDLEPGTVIIHVNRYDHEISIFAAI